jgi:hypothetical protein
MSSAAGSDGMPLDYTIRLTAKLETRAEPVMFARTNGVIGPDAG